MKHVVFGVVPQLQPVFPQLVLGVFHVLKLHNLVISKLIYRKHQTGFLFMTVVNQTSAFIAKGVEEDDTGRPFPWWKFLSAKDAGMLPAFIANNHA